MYYLGQAVKVEYEEDNRALGILLGKTLTTPKDSTDEDVWYSILIKDDEGKPRSFLFKEDCLGYCYDSKKKVMFGKTKTATLCTIGNELEKTDKHINELERINNENFLKMNGII